MFDIFYGDAELTVLILNIAIVAVLPIQLLLCFKAKRRLIRLLPVILFSAIAALCLLAALTASEWEGLGYILLAVFAAVLLCSCLIAWGIWWIIKRIKK